MRTLAVLLLLVSLAALPRVTLASNDLALVGGTLIDGTGHPPITDAALLIRDGNILWVGKARDARIPKEVRKINTTGMTVLPGLIDGHVHFSTAGHNDYARWEREFPESRVKEQIMPASAKALLAAGVTTARDLGGDLEDLLWLRDAERRGELPAPHMLIAGPLLLTPHRKFSGSIQDPGKYWIIHDPEEGRAKVRELAQRKVDAIKIWDDEFTQDEFTALISEAHAHRLPVAAHLLTLEGIQKAVAGGMAEGDSLEHIGAGPGSAYPEDLVRTIAAHRICVSPTLIAFEGVRQIAQDPHILDDGKRRSMLPPLIYQNILDSFRGFDPKSSPIYTYVYDYAPGRAAKLRQLRAAGALFVLGTDSGSRGNPHYKSAAREMVLLHQEVGLTNMEVIESATRIAAQALRLAARTGTLEPGKTADVAVVKGNPLENLTAMEHVAYVVKSGALVELH